MSRTPTLYLSIKQKMGVNVLLKNKHIFLSSQNIPGELRVKIETSIKRPPQ